MGLSRHDIFKNQKFMVNISRDVGNPESIELEIYLVPFRGAIRGVDRAGLVHLFYPEQIEARIHEVDKVDPPINIFGLEFGQSGGECFVWNKQEHKRTVGDLKTYSNVMDLIRKIHNGSVNVSGLEWKRHIIIQ